MQPKQPKHQHTKTNTPSQTVQQNKEGENQPATINSTSSNTPNTTTTTVKSAQTQQQQNKPVGKKPESTTIGEFNFHKLKKERVKVEETKIYTL